jgi:1-acyl-sn-glycerol-3-phosphate acyltransferase
MGVRFEAVLPDGEVSELGASVPRRGNRASRSLARLAFRLWGWRFAGSFPDVPKAIVVVVPHTTNWDFLVGVLALFALGLRISWLGKHTLFRWPLRPLMLWLDGVPVRRNSSSGTVAKLVETMRRRETMLLAVAPEGTRRAVSRWRMGFAHVAVGAGVPVVPVAFDWGRRVVALGPVFTLTSDLAADERMLRDWFADKGLEPGPPPPEP